MCVLYLSVISPSRQSCQTDRIVDISEDGSPSFVANVATEESACGSADNPWVFKAKPGQTLNITLFDFGVSHRNNSRSDSFTPTICR